MTRRTGVVALLALGVAVGACGKKKEPAQPTPQNPTPTAATPAGPDTAAENARRREAAEAERRRAMEGVRTSLTEMVFFDYDQSDIRADMQDVLNRKAALMRANPNVALRVDGHADERGTVEYNLALAEQRAQAAKAYLVALGIDASRVDTISRGETQPLDAGHDELAWAINRRAHFVVRGR
jgi:peptidoglycan-associated lipoprotein